MPGRRSHGWSLRPLRHPRLFANRDARMALVAGRRRRRPAAVTVPDRLAPTTVRTPHELILALPLARPAVPEGSRQQAADLCPAHVGRIPQTATALRKNVCQVGPAHPGTAEGSAVQRRRRRRALGPLSAARSRGIPPGLPRFAAAEFCVCRCWPLPKLALTCHRAAQDVRGPGRSERPGADAEPPPFFEPSAGTAAR
jgi:hypothetical protein